MIYRQRRSSHLTMMAWIWPGRTGPLSAPWRKPLQRATTAGRRPSKALNRGWLIWLWGGAVALVLSGCSGAPSTLDPRGPQAEQIAAVWWILLGVGAVVYLVVMLFLFVALFRRRAAFSTALPPENRASGNWIIAAGGLLMPVLVLSGVAALTFNALAALAQPPTQGAYTIQFDVRRLPYRAWHHCRRHIGSGSYPCGEQADLGRRHGAEQPGQPRRLGSRSTAY